MRILIIANHILPTSGFGGVSSSSREVLNSLRKRGFFVNSISTDPSKSFIENNKMGTSYFCKSLGSANFGFSLESMFRIPIEVTKSEIVFIRGLSHFNCFFALFCSIVLFKKFVFSAHGGLESRRYKNFSLLRKIWYGMNLLMIRLSKAILFTTKQEQKHSILKEKSLIIPNFYVPIKRKFTGPRSTDLLYVGRDSEEKNLDVIIKLHLSMINQNKDFKTRFVISGSCTNLSYKIQELKLEQKKGISIERDLNKEALSKAYSDSIFIILCSNLENFGNTVIEGMSYGCIPVTSDCIPWKHLEHNKSGLSFGLKTDITEICNKINSINKEAYSFNAKKIFKENYSEEKVIDIYEKIFKNNRK